MMIGNGYAEQPKQCASSKTHMIVLLAAKMDGRASRSKVP